MLTGTLSENKILKLLRIENLSILYSEKIQKVCTKHQGKNS